MAWSKHDKKTSHSLPEGTEEALPVRYTTLTLELF
jgi:hypothetical protein